MNKYNINYNNFIAEVFVKKAFENSLLQDALKLFLVELAVSDVTLENVKRIMEAKYYESKRKKSVASPFVFLQLKDCIRINYKYNAFVNIYAKGGTSGI